MRNPAMPLPLGKSLGVLELARSRSGDTLHNCLADKISLLYAQYATPLQTIRLLMFIPSIVVVGPLDSPSAVHVSRVRLHTHPLFGMHYSSHSDPRVCMRLG